MGVTAIIHTKAEKHTCGSIRVTQKLAPQPSVSFAPADGPAPPPLPVLDDADTAVLTAGFCGRFGEMTAAPFTFTSGIVVVVMPEVIGFVLLLLVDTVG